jgi:hypothetical protein
MFRREPSPPVIIHDTRTEYVTRNINVHEHRAPTDQSVALLKEMEKAAAEKIVETIRVGDTRFECVVHSERDCMNDQIIMRAVFSLNGRRETAEHRWTPNRGCPSGTPEAWVGLRDAIASVIATKMISFAMTQRQ